MADDRVLGAGRLQEASGVGTEGLGHGQMQDAWRRGGATVVEGASSLGGSGRTRRGNNIGGCAWLSLLLQLLIIIIYIHKKKKNTNDGIKYI